MTRIALKKSRQTTSLLIRQRASLRPSSREISTADKKFRILANHIEKDRLGRARLIDQGPTFGSTDIQPVSDNENLTELEQAFEDWNGEENVARSG
ncbi:hypothetical protein EON80_24730 [bacterium]|nr:MAG: hypothetical protein EON80_24730 [bacterium]